VDKPKRYKRPAFYNPDDIISHAEHKAREEALQESDAWENYVMQPIDEVWGNMQFDMQGLSMPTVNDMRDLIRTADVFKTDMYIAIKESKRRGDDV